MGQFTLVLWMFTCKSVIRKKMLSCVSNNSCFAHPFVCIDTCHVHINNNQILMGSATKFLLTAFMFKPPTSNTATGMEGKQSYHQPMQPAGRKPARIVTQHSFKHEVPGQNLISFSGPMK